MKSNWVWNSLKLEIGMKWNRILSKSIAFAFVICIGMIKEASAQQGPIKVIAPNGGEVFKVGDTVWIRYSANAYAVVAVRIKISADDGLTWHFISKQAFSPVDLYWEAYPWVVSAELLVEGQGTVSLLTDKLKIRVEHYNDPNVYDESDAVFSIVFESVVRRTGSYPKDRGTSFQAYAGLYDLSGVLIGSIVTLNNACDIMQQVKYHARPQGVYLLRLSYKGYGGNRRIASMR